MHRSHYVEHTAFLRRAQLCLSKGLRSRTHCLQTVKSIDVIETSLARILQILHTPVPTHIFAM